MPSISSAARIEDTEAESLERLQVRVYGEPSQPTLIYLPGSHGDWSVISGFRELMRPHFCFVEFTYPRTQTWTMQEYGEQIAAALRANGIHQGWLLGESFGSQVAWELLRAPGFHCEGIILCGGFIRHPFPWGAALFRRLCHRLLGKPERIPGLMQRYESWVKRSYEFTPQQDASIQEFKYRRTVTDGLAALHRLFLIQHNDPRQTAREFRGPVYYLGGFWDPLVPWYLVIPWLKRHCPSYAGSRILGRADHNVLFSAPNKSAQTILKWLGRE